MPAATTGGGGGGGDASSSAAAAAHRRPRPRPRRLAPLALLPILLTAHAATASAEDSVQYTGLVDRYYDGQVLVASAGSLVPPTQRLPRRPGGASATWPPFQSAEECRQACGALAGCNAFRFCGRADGCSLGDCGRWWAEQGGARLSAPPSSSSSGGGGGGGAKGALVQLPLRALGPFGGDAWRCVEPGKESAAAERRAAAVAAYAQAAASWPPAAAPAPASSSRPPRAAPSAAAAAPRSSSSSSPSGGGLLGGLFGRRRSRALLASDQGGGNNNQQQQQPSRWAYGTCTLLRVDDPYKPPAAADSSGGGGGWRSGTIALPDACLEKRTGQPVPPSADACRKCLASAARDGRTGGGPSPDVCASCAASAAATGEERSSSGGGSGSGSGIVDGARRAPLYAAMAGAAAAAAKGDGGATTLLGLQGACAASCAAAGAGKERDAAWKCPGCVLSGSPCAKCFHDRARRAALSAAFGGGAAAAAAMAAQSSSDFSSPGGSSSGGLPVRYDAGACVSCVLDVAKAGGRADLLFGGCVACAAHSSSGGGGGNGRCARCLAEAGAQRPWWWPAARRSRDRTPCDVCDASTQPGDDEAFNACVGCFRDPGYRGGPDCLRCALLDPKSVRRCYACVSRARMTDPRQRGCSDCMDYYMPDKERERCLSCAESAPAMGKAACSLCGADVVVDPGQPGAADQRRPAVGDRGRCFDCLGRGGLPATATLDDWRARCVVPASG